MRALSLRQPWASMIANGSKTIETRTWRTNYRGPLAIHASARPYEDLPTGGIIAVARLYDCRPMKATDEAAACIPLYDGAYAWLLADVQPVALIPCKGMLGLWTPPDDIMRMLPQVQPASDLQYNWLLKDKELKHCLQVSDGKKGLTNGRRQSAGRSVRHRPRDPCRAIRR